MTDPVGTRDSATASPSALRRACDELDRGPRRGDRRARPATPASGPSPRMPRARLLRRSGFQHDSTITRASPVLESARNMLARNVQLTSVERGPPRRSPASTPVPRRTLIVPPLPLMSERVGDDLIDDERAAVAVQLHLARGNVDDPFDDRRVDADPFKVNRRRLPFDPGRSPWCCRSPFGSVVGSVERLQSCLHRCRAGWVEGHRRSGREPGVVDITPPQRLLGVAAPRTAPSTHPAWHRTRSPPPRSTAAAPDSSPRPRSSRSRA